MLFVVALVVTMAIEVPIAQQISAWSIATMPENWQLLRCRWGTFHVVRLVGGPGGHYASGRSDALAGPSDG
jgi:hypothetical protein